MYEHRIQILAFDGKTEKERNGELEGKLGGGARGGRTSTRRRGKQCPTMMAVLPQLVGLFGPKTDLTESHLAVVLSL